MEGRFLLGFFGLEISCFEHQMHDSKLLSHKICSLSSKYLIFDCRASTGIFQGTDSKEYLSQYLHNHKYAAKLSRCQNLRSWCLLWKLKKCFEFLNLGEVFFYHEYNSSPKVFGQASWQFAFTRKAFQVLFAWQFLKHISPFAIIHHNAETPRLRQTDTFFPWRTSDMSQYKGISLLWAGALLKVPIQFAFHPFSICQ